VRHVRETTTGMTRSTRYDGLAEWYDRDFLGDAVASPTTDAAARLLGDGPGSLLDVGCGTGAHTIAFRDRGWSVTGVDVSVDMLRLARERGLDVVEADAAALPFDDESFDAVVSLWTHTDVDDFGALLAEATRVLRRGGPFVYIGAHPCFVGPHARFMSTEEVRELHPGYLDHGRYGSEAPGVSPDGLRAKVGGVHVPLGAFVQAFLDARLTLEHFEELENRPYPFTIAMRWRR
jgi:ubiquinone/menaquinone biosynthesis C-methylase UbiE